MAKTKYRVLEGIHWERKDSPTSEDSHDKYVKGEEFESEKEWDKISPFKFAKAGFHSVKVTEGRRQIAQELISSSMFGEEDRHFLETLPDEHLAHIIKSMKSKKAPVAEEELQDSNKEEKQIPPTDLGEDVTDRFSRCKEAGLKVFRNPAGKHQVVDINNPNHPVNPQPLTTNNKVNDFITAYLEEKVK